MDKKMTDTLDDIPQPKGSLAIQTIAMPQDANWNGDIFGGWLVSQMDLAGSVTARATAKGRVATVAIDSMAFLRPVPVSSVVSCYTQLLTSAEAPYRFSLKYGFARIAARCRK